MRTLILLLSSLLPLASLTEAADKPAQEPPRFGPFIALVMDTDYVTDVKYDDDTKIWILLRPQHKDKELILRLSNQDKKSYRKWANGEYQFVAVAERGNAANQFTDWIRTTANYVEYWIDDKMVLHLKRVGQG